MWADGKSAHICVPTQATRRLLVLKRALSVIDLAFTVFGDADR
jgi:hypothetical protein